jgi:hypothetical protein
VTIPGSSRVLANPTAAVFNPEPKK